MSKTTVLILDMVSSFQKFQVRTTVTNKRSQISPFRFSVFLGKTSKRKRWNKATVSPYKRRKGSKFMIGQSAEVDWGPWRNIEMLCSMVCRGVLSTFHKLKKCAWFARFCGQVSCCYGHVFKHSCEVYSTDKRHWFVKYIRDRATLSCSVKILNASLLLPFKSALNAKRMFFKKFKKLPLSDLMSNQTFELTL